MDTNFPITNNPSMSPACCGICGYADKDRRYLDFAGKLDFEWYGSLAICEICVGAMANDLGFLNPAQALSLENRVTEAEQELVTLRAAVLQLETIGDIVAGLVSSGIVRTSDSDDLALSDAKPESGILDTPDRVEGSANSRSSQQTSGERSDDVSSLIAGADDLLANL